ncbi:sensor histidine kinase [Nocardioides pacificus]
MNLQNAARGSEMITAQARRGTGHFTLLFLGVVLAPPLVTSLVLLSDGAPFASVQVISRALGQVLLGAAGVALYLHWRLGKRDVSGWLAAAVFAAATYGIPFALLDLASARTSATLTLPGTADLLSSLASLTLVLAAARRVRVPVWLDPLALGMVLGLGTVVLHVILISVAGGIQTYPGSSPMFQAATMVVGLAMAASLATMRGLPRLARAQLSIGVGFMVVTGTLAPSVGGGPVLGLPLAVLHIGGAALGAWTAVTLCRTLPGLGGSPQVASFTPQRSLPTLDWGAALAAEVRHYEETMHELRSTVAGLSAASRILHDAQYVVPAADRARLERMQAEEMARLERLLAGEADEPLRAVELDDVVQPVVTSVRARGHQVRCEASGVHALGRPDHIAEAVHILLDNAARHSSGSGVSLEITTVDHLARITVSDDGPGVPDHLADAIFEWGTQRPDSRGRGIGLHIARRLVGELGGTLELDRNHGPRGAAFVIDLPLITQPLITPPLITQPNGPRPHDPRQLITQEAPCHAAH